MGRIIPGGPRINNLKFTFYLYFFVAPSRVNALFAGVPLAGGHSPIILGACRKRAIKPLNFYLSLCLISR